MPPRLNGSPVKRFEMADPERYSAKHLQQRGRSSQHLSETERNSGERGFLTWGRR